MNNRHLFTKPGGETPYRHISIGPDREIFRPEWNETLLTLTAGQAGGGNRK